MRRGTGAQVVNLALWKKAGLLLLSFALIFSLSNLGVFIGTSDALESSDEEPVSSDPVMLTFMMDDDLAKVVRPNGAVYSNGDMLQVPGDQAVPFEVKSLATPNIDGVTTLYQPSVTLVYGSPIAPIEDEEVEQPEDTDGSLVEETEGETPSPGSTVDDDGTGAPSDSNEDSESSAASEDGAVEAEVIQPVAALQGLEASVDGDGSFEAVEQELEPDPDYPDGNHFKISVDTLQAALEANAEISVFITMNEVAAEQVSTWEELKNALQSPGDADPAQVGIRHSVIELTADIEDVTFSGELSAPATVKAGQERTIQLNGHTISNKNNKGDAGKNLFVVPTGSTLTIADAASSDISSQSTGWSKTTDSQNAAQGIDGAVAPTGDLASYDSNTKILTYNVTKSQTDNYSTGSTVEHKATCTLDMSQAGSIEVEGIDNVVANTGGNLFITGGLISGKNSNRAICSIGGKVGMSGGFIVDSGQEGDIGITGGALLAVNGSDIAITGDAVIAGNKVGNKGNGGALYMQASQLAISGNAIIAGNYAGPKRDSISTSNKGSFFDQGNGGAVYLQFGSTATIGGNAVLAGNRAACDGGAVYVSYVNQTKAPSSLTVKENALLTNNVAAHDLRWLHPADGKAVNADYYTGGGGAIFARDTVTLEGGFITANYSQDGGGGILMTLKSSRTDNPLFKMSSAIIAGNYAEASEGGGLWLQTKEGSSVDSGKISNNATGTWFDWGGGGLYLNSHGSLTIWHPLVTGNGAKGFGGGAAVCQNGASIEAGSAIYDNSADQTNHTTNTAVEFGDLLGMAEYLGIPDHASDDLYSSAKESTVYGGMLGGGDANWSGYVAGPAKYVFNITRTGFSESSPKTTITSRDPGTNSNAAKQWLSAYNICINNEKTNNNGPYFPIKKGTLSSYSDVNSLSEALTGSLVIIEKAFDLKTKKSATTPTIKGMVKRAWIASAEELQNESESDRNDYYTVFLDIDETVDPGNDATSFGMYHGGRAINNGGEVVNAESENVSDELFFWKILDAKEYPRQKYGITGTPVGAAQNNYYAIYEFGGSQTDAQSLIAPTSANPDGGYVKTHFLALKANPDASAVSQAQAKAASTGLYITGNRSNTNGGGIGCNGVANIGKDMENPTPPGPTEPESETRDITINKYWLNPEGLDMVQDGTRTVTFVIECYEDRAASKPVYITERSIIFSNEELNKSVMITDLDARWTYIKVYEKEWNGDNASSLNPTKVVDGSTVTFSNFYEDEGYSTGLINRYTPGASEPDRISG